MFIVMHCGGMPFDGNTIKEKSLGGSESAAYYMAKELSAQGHEVKLFTRTDKPMVSDGVSYVPIGPVTEQEPLGADFHYYSMNTLIDVMIIQRHPLAFQYPWSSKINLLWLHDLATYSTRDHYLAQMPFVDGVLTVSEWHKEQVVKVWGLEPEIVMPIQNGVDLSLYENETDYLVCKNLGTIVEQEEGTVVTDPICDAQFKMLYTSRPERGLENLVKADGIMERLAKEDPKYHLYVCNYDNTMPQMAGYYNHLYQRCEELPNITLLGHLTKQELADVQRQCDLCVYPTSFEETSCITAMECMAAGLPMLSSKVGALPETTKDSGSWLVSTLEKDSNYRGAELQVEGKANNDAFVSVIMDWASRPKFIMERSAAQLQMASKFAWFVSADMLMVHVQTILENSFSSVGYMKQCLRNSDIYALKELPAVKASITPITDAVESELEKCYGFIDGKWVEHYAAYYEYEKNRGVNYGPENLDGNARFEHVSSLVQSLPPESIVLDYGCAHGHYTVNLAKRFPHLGFIGVDIAQSNVAKAREWTQQEGLANVIFLEGSVENGELEIRDKDFDGSDFALVDLIIAAEVLEHLESPAVCADALADKLNPDGKMIITVPYGPWEAQGYKEHWPWRAHVHHLDRSDLHELFGMHDGFQVTVIPSGHDRQGHILGSYALTYNKPITSSGQVDYVRKQTEAKPQQTLSLCMIAKDAQATIETCLSSVVDVVDEVIVGVDDSTSDDTIERIEAFCQTHRIPCNVFNIVSPIKQGFDAARNQTIKKASGDWILWLDSDEIVNHPERLVRFLRNNQFNGYAIAQHHFTMEPAGVMKTDYPVRLFRSNVGIKFYGVVHEHPEQKLNKGIGFTIVMPGVEIGHYGYQNEDTRRGRFQRNIDLLIRDREQNPDRNLGKFLWIRDLSQMCGFEIEAGHGISKDMMERAERGVELFGELIADKELLRMCLDGLPFYSNLSRLLSGGFDYDAQLESHRVQGHFHKKEHLQTLVDLIINEKVNDNEESKYL